MSSPSPEGSKNGAKLVGMLLPNDARDLLASACEANPELKAKVIERVKSTSEDKCHKIFSKLKNAFQSGRTRPYEWRINQLRQLLKMIRDGRQVLCEALQKDLHRSVEEGYLYDLNGPEHNAQEAIDNLKEWMEGDTVPTNLLNLPASSKVHPDPLGVALIYGCWNYPYLLSVQPLVGAIAAGNTVAVKLPSDMAEHSSNALARLMEEYLDTEAIVPILGGIRTNQALLKERWDKIFFTGSTRVGKIVYASAAQHLTPVTLELGGKSPTIVCKSSNIEVACRRVTWARYMNAGQSCIAPDHVFVHADVADKFKNRLCELIVKFYGTDAKKTEFFGRLVNRRSHARVVSIAQEHKDKVLVGGVSDEKENYLSPTVVYYGSDWKAFTSSKAMSEEIFGPILPIATFRDFSKVVDYINKGEKPLTSYLFSNDKKEQYIMTNQTTSGSLVINDCMVQMTNGDLPFGGVGASGIGAYHGKYSFDAFSHKKAVLIRSDKSTLDAPIRYPPYVPFKYNLLSFLQHPTPTLSVSVALMLHWVITILLERLNMWISLSNIRDIQYSDEEGAILSTQNTIDSGSSGHKVHTAVEIGEEPDSNGDNHTLTESFSQMSQGSESTVTWRFKKVHKIEVTKRILDAFITYTYPTVSKWKINPSPVQRTTKVAMIVEMRQHRYFKWIVKDVMNYLGHKWGLLVFYGSKNEDFVRKELSDVPNVHFLPVMLEDGLPPNLNQVTYGHFLTLREEFWNRIPKNIEHMLVFQTDALALRRPSRHELKRWLKNDYIGSPWDFHVRGMEHPDRPANVNKPSTTGLVETNAENLLNATRPMYYSGNGGFSLRSVPASRAVLDCVHKLNEKRKKTFPNDMEDQLFVHCFRSNGYKVANWVEARDFSVESLKYQQGKGHRVKYHPFGMHQAFCFQPDWDYARFLASSQLAMDAGFFPEVDEWQATGTLLKLSENTPNVDVLLPI
ncbi:hypothetical protein AAMO2058_001158600 [Amorphochlora amoebiformis]